MLKVGYQPPQGNIHMLRVMAIYLQEVTHMLKVNPQYL